MYFVRHRCAVRAEATQGALGGANERGGPGARPALGDPGHAIGNRDGESLRDCKRGKLALQ